MILFKTKTALTGTGFKGIDTRKPPFDKVARGNWTEHESEVIVYAPVLKVVKPPVKDDNGRWVVEVTA